MRGRQNYPRLIAASHVLLAVASELLLAPVASADQVEGTFKSSEKGIIKPTITTALPTRAPWDLELEGVEILLTSIELDAATALDSLDPSTHLRNQEGMLDNDFVTIMVWDDGDVAVNATFHEGNHQFIDNTKMQLQAEITERSAELIKGRVWTPGPVELPDGESYEVDLSFETRITQPKATTPLPEGGGAPGEVLTETVAAARSGNWTQLASHITTEQRAEIENGWSETDEERIQMVPGLSWFLDSPDGKVTVVDGTLRDDGIADLEVRLAVEGMTYVLSARLQKLDEERWAFLRSSFVTVE